MTITPCGAYEVPPLTNSSIPSSIVKEQTFYLPPYNNESIFMDLPALCRDLEIPHYHGRYNGPRDLSGFKGIIHLPYQWSTLAFFENVALGIPYFIPSPAFLEKLIRSGNYFHPGSDSLIDEKLFHLSEWYSPEHADFMIYFDSWEDLKEKTLTTDLASVREKMKNYGAAYKTRMIEKWKRVFETLLIE